MAQVNKVYKKLIYFEKYRKDSFTKEFREKNEIVTIRSRD
jgi:hypothetical protein